MSDGRAFPLDEILTVSTGRLVARRHMDAVYDVLNYLTGHSLFTHQLPRALDACLPHVLAQHPDLEGIQVPADAELIWPWLEAMEARYGTERTLTPIPDWEHQDAIEELADKVGAERVWVVNAGTEEGDPQP